MFSGLPVELDFIRQYDLSEAGVFESDCIKSPISDNLWSVEFDDPKANNFQIDFSVLLDNESTLTDARNADLLRSFKQFILAQTSPYLNGGKVLSDVSKCGRIRMALQVLDHLLLNGSKFNLANGGCLCLSKGEVRAVIALISSGRLVKASLYQPIEAIETFFKSLTMDCTYIEKLRRQIPEISIIDHTDRTLNLDDHEIVSARAWMYKKGLCYKGTEYLYTASTQSVLAQIWKNRILGSAKFISLPLSELSFNPWDGIAREYPAVPVSSAEDERASEDLVGAYRKVLSGMTLVNEYGVGMIDDGAIKALSEKPEYVDTEVKEKGRFSTLPFDVSRKALEDAFSFYFEYGEVVVEGLKEVIRSGNSNNITSSLKTIGVKRVKLPLGTSGGERFRLLRENASLLGMRDVLFGSCVIIFNSLMARRVSELAMVRREDIIRDRSDPNLYRLGVCLRKANIGNHREYVFRPIPKSCADMLKLIYQINELMRHMGLSESTYVFSDFTLKTSKGLCEPSVVNDPSKTNCHINRWLDAFCDYHQTPLDEFGRRLYIRSHQLRRNFAMLFFWQGGYGGLEVLRYFLGHKKPSHTYRYITETCQGKVLNKVKADVAAKEVVARSSAVEDIVKLISKRYGVDKLTILPEKQLSIVLQDMIEAGEVEVEPEFYEDDAGEQYTITYIVKEVDHG